MAEVSVSELELSPWKTSVAGTKNRDFLSTKLNDYFTTNGEKDGSAVIGSSNISGSNSEDVDSGGVQLVDGVGSARQRTTGALSASVSGSPDHLPTGHPPTGHTPGEGDGGGCYGAH